MRILGPKMFKQNWRMRILGSSIFCAEKMKIFKPNLILERAEENIHLRVSNQKLQLVKS